MTDDPKVHKESNSSDYVAMVCRLRQKVRERWDSTGDHGLAGLLTSVDIALEQAVNFISDEQERAAKLEDERDRARGSKEIAEREVERLRSGIASTRVIWWEKDQGRVGIEMRFPNGASDAHIVPDILGLRSIFEYAERHKEAIRLLVFAIEKIAYKGDNGWHSAMQDWVDLSPYIEPALAAVAVLAKNPAPQITHPSGETRDVGPTDVGGEVSGEGVKGPSVHSIFRAEAREVWTTITGNGPGLWKDYDLQSVATIEKALQRASSLSQGREA